MTSALHAAPGASPGLLRRRYSVPETIMRKYRLAQMRSDSEDSEPATAPSRPASLGSPAPGSCASLSEPQSRARRVDTQLVRKSAMLRRLWGTSYKHSTSNVDIPPYAACCCECDYRDERETRSLGSSHAELGGSVSSKTNSHLAGWATPKRQRLISPNKLTSSEEMLRTAVGNSYNQERERRDELSSDSTTLSHARDPSFRDVSCLTESPESISDQPRKKRRQRICTYANFPDTPKAEKKSENVTDITEGDSPTCLSQQTTTESTFITSEFSEKITSQVYSDNVIVVNSDSCDANECLTARTESSYSKSEDEPTCIARVETKFVEKHKTKKPKPTQKLTESTMEILEIIVSESSTSENKSAPVAIENRAPASPVRAVDIIRYPLTKFHPSDIDQYVSNILVESLNSLTDQIEEINSRMDDEHKISIVEKEIKVKLQNTGMNTIVHLSPNSNNPIIFGPKDLYDNLEVDYTDDNDSDKGTIKIELTDSNDLRLTDSSEMVTHISAKELENDGEFPKCMINNENINKSVLQQIQKLFNNGFDRRDSTGYSEKTIPEIKHIEISNVDVFINNNTDPNFDFNDQIEIQTDGNTCQFDCDIKNCPGYLSDSFLGEVGTGTSYFESAHPVLVPRFSALPHTESMEVNTSSPEDVETLGSDCTSLVDSLDDPNSPRNILLRRACRNSRRNELVRSAIDVLDLLPDISHSELRSREKSESFFIRITDGDCDCEKENVVVADHMPDKIKQRLFRRHKKRELRMEYAKRKKVKHIKRESERQRSVYQMKSKNEIERDCKTILQSLVDEVLAKIVEEEHKFMRIKQTSSKFFKNKNDSVSLERKQKNKQIEEFKKVEPLKTNGDLFGRSNGIEGQIKEEKSKNFLNKKSQSLQSSVTPIEDRGPKRFYQKSEFHEGNKCIEILEILEYADSSQSSADVNHDFDNIKNRCKKSKIPVPVYEKVHRLPKVRDQNLYINLIRSSPNLRLRKSTDNLENEILVDTNDKTNVIPPPGIMRSQYAPVRRASVPQQEMHRSRSNTLRFKQIFDIIPEEKSSLSIESSTEDFNFNQKIPSQVMCTKQSKEHNNNKLKYENKSTMSDTSSKISKSTSTSPLNNGTNKINKLKTKATSTLIDNNNFESNQRNEDVQEVVVSSKKSSSSLSSNEGWTEFCEPRKQLVNGSGIRLRQTHIH